MDTQPAFPSPRLQLPPRLQLRGITKRYAAVTANDSVDLTVSRGEIHALLGENGAGKSTLVKIIYGVVKPDAGDIIWQGRPTTIADPKAARALGIGMVFQHFSLFETLTVSENIALGLGAREPLRTLADRIRAVADRYRLAVEPNRHVHHLSVGERQRVEIVRCLLQDPSLLIMDEPTSVLTPQEVEGLFVMLRRLSAEGCSILYISHKLDEIKALCQSATVLRGGRVTGHCDPRRETAAAMAERMIGSTLPQTRRNAPAQTATPADTGAFSKTGAATPEAHNMTGAQALKPDNRTSAQASAPDDLTGAQAREPNNRTGVPALELNGLTLPADEPFGTGLHDIRLSVRAGEIVGIAGVAGNGQKELLAVISGERRAATQSAIRIANTDSGSLGATARRRLGLAFIPEERLGRGAVAEMSLTENALLTCYPTGYVSGGFVQFPRLRAFAAGIIEKFRVHAAGIEAEGRSLSGGNMQKFIIGREVGANPKILVAAHPTWGVDIGAALSIRQELIDLTATGVAILVVSEDLAELFEICDRIAVLHAGHLSEPRPAAATTMDELGLLMGGVTRRESADA